MIETFRPSLGPQGCGGISQTESRNTLRRRHRDPLKWQNSSRSGSSWHFSRWSSASRQRRTGLSQKTGESSRRFVPDDFFRKRGGEGYVTRDFDRSKCDRYDTMRFYADYCLLPLLLWFINRRHCFFNKNTQRTICLTFGKCVLLTNHWRYSGIMVLIKTLNVDWIIYL